MTLPWISGCLASVRYYRWDSVRTRRDHRLWSDPQAQEKALKKFREQFGHTRVAVLEAIPGKCGHLVIGTERYGSLPVMDEVKREARQRGIVLLIVRTEEAVQALARKSKGTNAILHLTCERHCTCLLQSCRRGHQKLCYFTGAPQRTLAFHIRLRLHRAASSRAAHLKSDFNAVTLTV
jgi:hypothetical protein